MVRLATYRRRKYQAKVDHNVAEKRTDAYRDTMVTLQTAITTICVAKEIEAKETILEPAGVPTSEMSFYLNAMREFCKCSRQFTGVTRNNKCYSILLNYRDKGFVAALLYKLAAMCGCYPLGYEYYV